jgi:hypothetical protein
MHVPTFKIQELIKLRVSESRYNELMRIFLDEFFKSGRVVSERGDILRAFTFFRPI